MVTNTCSCHVVAKFTDPLRDVMDIRWMTSEYFAIWFAGSGSRTSQNWSDQGPKPKEVLFFLRESPAGPPRMNFDGIAILFFV